MPLRAYCLPWHLTQSKAFDDILVAPLSSKLKIELVAWDGEAFLEQWIDDVAYGRPIIFCQKRPPQALLQYEGARIVWLPMWNNVMRKSHDWWTKLPKNIRIVSFSKEISRRSCEAGLKTLEIQFALSPSNFSAQVPQDRRVLFYWNRCGLVGPQFLTKLCQELSLDVLLYRPDLDPNIPNNFQYQLPRKIGKTKVEIVSNFSHREDYFKAISNANIVLAPRPFEGVGLTFLEFMARGAAVLAADNSTMNEYIIDGVSGILFNPPRTNMSLFNKVFNKERKEGHFYLPMNQNWENMRHLNVRLLGENAISDMSKKYKKWSATLSDYKDFIDSW